MNKDTLVDEDKENDTITNKDIQAKNNYTFYEDSSHGWLEVPLQELKDLGIQERITSFSYVFKGMAYLEEDLDAGTFLDIRNKLPNKAEIRNHCIDGLCYIRNYSHYEPGKVQSWIDKQTQKNTRDKDIGWER
jgi:hypothetical protein